MKLSPLVKFTNQRLSLSDDSLSTPEKNKSSFSNVLRAMKWNIHYNGIVITKRDEDIIDVFQESYCIKFSEDVYNSFILNFLQKFFS